MKLFCLLCLIFALSSHSLIADSPRVRNIIVRGTTAFSDREILDIMQTKVGWYFTEEQLQQDFENIIAAYEENGYRFARIEEELLSIKKFPDGVYIRIHIDEGMIGKITVSGNRRTKDYVIIQELLFQVGSVYTWEDELESERILRRKPYLGTAEILATRDPETRQVWVQVEVTDLWTFFPALDLPAFSSSSAGFLLSLSDSNLLGTGNDASIRYQLITEADEASRSLISTGFTVPRLYGSYWNFDGTYTQKREGDSWSATLQHPLYSLKTRWSADFTLSESIDLVRWYENGEKTDTFKRSQNFQSGRVVRTFGGRHQQTQLALWSVAQRTKFTHIESLAASDADFQNRNVRMVGVSVGYRNVDFIRTRFLEQMGRVEDIELGYALGASIGYASPFYGSDRVQTSTTVFANFSQAHRNWLFLNANANVTARFTKQGLDNSVLTTNVRIFGKDFLHQTLGAQLSTVLGFSLDGESQVILGGENGLRGYDSRAFSGDKLIRFNIESRKIWWEHSLVVVGSVVFADVGYVWNGQGFDFDDPKRSVGIGLRLGFPKLSGARVYRVDLAYPIDRPDNSQFDPVLTFATGHVF